MSTQQYQQKKGIEKDARVVERFKYIKQVIVIMSGKGGMGKSTVAANLALALSERVGAGQVGIVDAYIHGPNIPKILLSILQFIPEIAEFIIVTTPQEGALRDCQKTLSMVLQMQKSVLGVIESEFICPSCGQHHKIFGEEGGKKLADQFNVEFLGSVPIDLKLRKQEDKGLELAFEPFREIARRIHEKLNER